MSIFPLLEVYQDNVPRSAAMNMALDEVFWQSATTPRLRFYQWDHSAISFGYFGQYEEVAHYQPTHELVRRCTGGGIVFHGNDLTYALVIPPSDLAGGRSPMAVYAFVHAAIKNCLCASGIAASLVAPANCRASVSGAIPSTPSHRDRLQLNSCFANPVAADVLVDGRKIAGAAQRRSRRGLLQQGSIQNIQLPMDFRDRFTHALAAKVVAGEIDFPLLEKAGQLAELKYRTDNWLRRR